MDDNDRHDDTAARRVSATDAGAARPARPVRPVHPDAIAARVAMRGNDQISARPATKYSGGVLVVLFIIGLIGSMLDLTFLQDVLGRILNLSSAMALLISLIIGLVASVALMGLAGYRQGHEAGGGSKLREMPEFWIWIVVGVILVVVRLMTGTIVEVDSNEATVKFGFLIIRSSDLVTAPLMFALYLGTGLLVNFCAREFFYTDMYLEWAENHAKKKTDMKQRRQEAIAQADERNRKRLEMADAARKEQLDKRERMLAERQAADDKRKMREGYDLAVSEYKKVEQSVHAQHQRISVALTELEEARAELERTKVAYRRLLDNVDKSRIGTQNEVALLVHYKTPEVSVETLQGIIDQYNAKADN